MDNLLISEIQTFTLNARAVLEDENGQQLEGIYGWLPDGTFAAAEKYPALAQLDEARETRQRLEQFAADEKAIGVPGKDARTKLIREVVFTWLNRFVAFRLLEERRLIKETISRLGDSNAFKLWLADDANEATYTEYQKGGLPLNAMGEGPSDVAYRRFLLSQCGEQAKDVSVLFYPEALASRLFPRPLILKQLVSDMNAADLAEAWKPGNEETVGWIYQAFNAEELQAAFAGAREQGKKFEPQDIPAVTQLFTVRWVVRFLVENTLGRLWVEMHPDSRLRDSLAYLVPIEKPQERPVKLAREISFLDPCCGSMHFGLLAFDLFAEIYNEELERAGTDGWPEKASVNSAEDIPFSIVAHNIYGIDIDVRAIQLSALTLLLRARTLNPKCDFTDENLASANIEQLTAGRLDEFIKQARFSHPIYERILKAIAARLKDSENLGSLLRLERDLETLVADERKKAEADKQFRLAFPALSSEHFTTREGIEEFFEIISEQIMRHLDTFVKESRSAGEDADHFVAEAAKGLRFLRIIQHRFDVVTTNPPYLSNRKMNNRLAGLMAEEYSEAKRDLYAGFIVRCQELLNNTGLLGMLTMHSFMFISSYEDLRAKLRDEIAIETLAHFGGGLFAVGNPGTLQTAAFVLRREHDAQRRDRNAGVYFRLVKEPDAESKRGAFEDALTTFRHARSHLLVFRYIQKDFDRIPGHPWIYWMPDQVIKTFSSGSLREIAEPRQGMATADNKRFLRAWWEVGKSMVERNARTPESAANSGKKWFPYMKGGTPISWFGNQVNVVNYYADGKELKAHADPLYGNSGWSRIIKSTDVYFRPGVTWSDVSSKGFAARLSPGGFVHDVKGMTCFPNKDDIPFVLGLLNSRFAKFVMEALNPTLSFQVGDIERLPIPAERSPMIDELVNQCVTLARQVSHEDETTYDFVEPLRINEERTRRSERLASIETEIDVEVSRLYGLNQENLEAIARELSSQNTSINGGEPNNEGGMDVDEGEAVADLSVTEWVQRWVAYAVGAILNRFEISVTGGLGCGSFSPEVVVEIRKLIDRDGLMVSDKGHPQDIVKRVLDCLGIMLGRGGANEMIRIVTDREGDAEDLLRDWIDRQFWKYHFKIYRKRPIYWPLQSPKKKFTAWVFQERFTKDTLFKLRTEFVEPKVRWLESRIRELKDKAKSTTGRESRNADKEASQLADVLDDVQEFAKRLTEISQRGYTPHIDDGVLLNAAPLWELLPSWPETKKAWHELKAGKYDWAHQAMEYWPERVKEACKTNKSFAIAHGLA